MRKIGRKLLASVVAGAALMSATPASAGVAFIYYYDYPGGTPAGYRIYCNSGEVQSWGEETGIFYVDYNYVFC